MKIKNVTICSVLLLIVVLVCVKVQLTRPIKLAICGMQEPYLFTISNYKNIEVTYGGKYDYENMKFDPDYKVVRDYMFVAPHMYTETFQLTSDESKQLKKLIKNIKKSDSTRPNQIVTDVKEIKVNIGGREYYSIYYSGDISDEPPAVLKYYNEDLVAAADMISELSNLKNMIEFK